MRAPLEWRGKRKSQNAPLAETDDTPDAELWRLLPERPRLPDIESNFEEAPGRAGSLSKVGLLAAALATTALLGYMGLGRVGAASVLFSVSQPSEPLATPVASLSTPAPAETSGDGEPASAGSDWSSRASQLAMQPALAPTPAPVAPPAAPPPPPQATTNVVNAPGPFAAAPAAPTISTVHGVSDHDIRLGMVSPFSGANREAGRQLKLGVEAAFDEVDEAGGVGGRQLRLITSDDGYEPNRTLGAMQDLYEKQNVFGYIGNFGSATAAVAAPYALQKKALFLGALSGAGILRQDPPDRYVFNYRPSYAEETAAAVRYLVKVRRIALRDIAVFAQDDAFGDAGYEGVAKAMRTLPNPPDTVLRLNYKRNTIEVDDALNDLKAAKGHIRAVIMVATYRAAAKFIEKTRDAYPSLVYTNVSAVGASSLADELMLLGPHYADGVIVTQDTPAVAGSASFVLKYKNALAKYFPGELPDYTSFEAYIDANILIEALKRVGPQIDIEKLVDTMESMRDLDLGLGAPLRFSINDHQGSHKVWGTKLDTAGHYGPIDLE